MLINKDNDNLDYCNNALKFKKDIENNFIVLAEYLYNIKEHNLFEPQWSSWLEFVDEMKMSPNMANRLVQIHKVFVLTYKFTPDEITTGGGWAVLQEILPAITSRKEALRWLESANTLTRQDLRRELIEHKTGIDMTKCKHKDTYTVKICRDCGDRWQ